MAKKNMASARRAVAVAGAALLFLAGGGAGTFLGATDDPSDEGKHPPSLEDGDTCDSSSSTTAAAEGGPNAADGGDGGGGGAPSLHVIPIPRISAPNVTTKEFTQRYVSPPGGALPLHIVESRGVDPADWTRAKLRELCGDAPLVFTRGCGEDATDLQRKSCHSVKYTPRRTKNLWGGLEKAHLGDYNISTWGDLLDVQDGDESEGGGGGEGRKLYLHDNPLSRTCPAALDALPGSPKYFRRDYGVFEAIDKRGPHLAKVRRDSPRFWDEFGRVDYFPSIFVGKGDGVSGSRLHSDTGLTRAFMLHLSGRKSWRLAAPSDRHKLGPLDPYALFGEGGASIFSADLFEPNFASHPGLDGMTVYEGIADPGDVVFFPEGWPHQVRNLDDTVAVSVNFVDNGNLDAAGEYNFEEEGSDDYVFGLASSLLTPLDDPPFRESSGWDGEATDFVPFREYYMQQGLRLKRDVPSSVRRLVEEGRSNATASGDGDEEQIGGGIGAIRDRFGDTILHDAATYGHIGAVRYLLEEGGLDPNVLDECGRTPLHAVNAGWRDREVRNLLTRHGGRDYITDECEKRLEEEEEEEGGDWADIDTDAMSESMRNLMEQAKTLQAASRLQAASSKPEA